MTQKLPQSQTRSPVSFSIIAMPMTSTISALGVNTVWLTRRRLLGEDRAPLDVVLELGDERERA